MKKVSLIIDEHLFNTMVKCGDIPCVLCKHFSFAEGCTDTAYDQRCELDLEKVTIKQENL